MHVIAHNKAERDPIIYPILAIPIKETNGTKGHKNVVGAGGCGSASSNSMDAIPLAMDTASKNLLTKVFRPQV
jgi:hypothetical protein